MRSFASDNNSGVHPRVMDAIIKANDNHAVGYGDDPWTEAATSKIQEVFGKDASPFFVFNGTGANSVALQAVTRPFNSILCAFGVCHHSQPKAVYISQVSELGTIYTIEEVKAIADLLHSYDMYLHMDGARLANACAYLNCTMRQVTVDAGVDILSFGGTKNGMMMGEAVVSFRPEITENLRFYRKQSAQLASKLRYLSAQFIPYLENNLWLENAMKANISAAKLADVLRQYPEIHFTQKIESNQLFFTIPAEALRKLQDKYFFYMWNEEINEARLVTSWDTSGEDIAEFEQSLKEIFG